MARLLDPLENRSKCTGFAVQGRILFARFLGQVAFGSYGLRRLLSLSISIMSHGPRSADPVDQSITCQEIDMLKEFKEFAMKGNMIDMAVGIIIGGAFGTIVKSLVNDIIMPPIGLLLGGIDFTNIFLTLKGNTEATLEAAKKAGAVTMNVGVFVNAAISFLIVAFSVFLLVKVVNAAKKKEEEVPAEPAEPPRQEVLLEEIRDLLKK